MTWIAKTDGAVIGTPSDLREAALTDIPTGDRGNWRAVDNTPPAYDRLTQQVSRTALAIQPDGSVSVVWTTTNEPALVRILNLTGLAKTVARTKINTNRVTVFGREVAISDEQIATLNRAKLAIDAGQSSVTVVTADGEVVSLNSTNLTTATNAVASARETVWAAMRTVVTDVRSGAVTTSDGVRSHSAW